MAYNIRLSICVFLLTMAWAVSAAQNPDTIWTLEACIRYAVEHSPDVARQEARNVIARENYREAIAGLLPSLNASAGGEFSFGRAVDPETNAYNDINTFSNTYRISSGLTLFAGLTAVNQLRLQKMNRLTGRHQLRHQCDMVAYATMESFLRVQYAQDLAELSEQQLAESTRNRERAERMQEMGLRGMPDVAEMRAKEASDRFTLTRNRNTLAIAVILLKEKMNFPLDEPLVISPYRGTHALAVPDYTAEALFDRATSSLPRAQAVESTLRAQEFQFRATKGRLSPTLSASAGMNTSFVRYSDRDFLPYEEQLRNKRGSYVGMSLSIPIFSGLSRSGAVRRGRQTLTIARIDHDAALRGIYSDIVQALSDLRGQSEAWNQAIRQREAVETAHVLNERKYEEGLLGALEFHTSANRLMQARTEEMNAQVTYYLKRKLVGYYAGEPFLEE